MAREQGFVYYEADCFANLKNPYIPLDAKDPSLAQMKQKKLKEGDRNKIFRHLISLNWPAQFLYLLHSPQF